MAVSDVFKIAPFDGAMELKELNGGSKVCNAKASVRAGYGDRAKYIAYKLVTWGNQAERFNDWVSSGEDVQVDGEIVDVNTYTSKDGDIKYEIVVNVNRFRPLGVRDSQSSGGGNNSAPATVDEDEIPF